MNRKSRTIRTQFNPKYHGTSQPIPDQSSLTVPDQNMGIRDLLSNHSRGLPLGAHEREGQYFDTEIPRFDDLTDMIEYREMLAQKHKELESQIKADQESAKAKELALEKKSPPTLGDKKPEVSTNL